MSLYRTTTLALDFCFFSSRAFLMAAEQHTRLQWGAASWRLPTHWIMTAGGGARARGPSAAGTGVGRLAAKGIGGGCEGRRGVCGRTVGALAPYSFSSSWRWVITPACLPFR